jgi:hypothetical protein
MVLFHMFEDVTMEGQRPNNSHESGHEFGERLIINFSGVNCEECGRRPISDTYLSGKAGFLQ